MTKLAIALLMLSACTTAEDDIVVDPDRGGDVGIEQAPRVTGVVRGVGEGRVVLGNDGWVDSREIANGGFAFDAVPDGTYFARLEIAGVASDTETVVVREGTAHVTLDATPLAGGFAYQWSRDTSHSGHEQGTLIGSARILLRTSYGIELSDEELVWSDEHAARLLETMRAVPQRVSTQWRPIPMAPTTWVLSSATAFATGRYVTAELHQEIVAHVTQNGRNRVAVDKILLERYGVRAYLFSDAESVTLISMLEDMPQRMRSMPGLLTIIRRSGGAPVRASVTDGSLEIADTAFAMDRAVAQLALVRAKAEFLMVSAETADAVARFVTTGEGGDSLGLDAQRPITDVSIRAQGRQVSVTLGLQAAADSSVKMFVFNGQRLQMLRLEPELGTRGTVLRGDVTLSAGGAWRPDGIVLVTDGVETVLDPSELGWRLEVE